MLDLYLHVGVYKTGTTAIQTTLLRNAKKLLDDGIYLPMDKSGNQHNLYLSLKSSINAGKEELINTLISSAEKANCSSILISSEGIINDINSNFEKLRTLSNFFNVKVIMYIRRQDFYNESLFCFESGNFLNKSNISIQDKGYDYYRLYENIKGLFADSEIIIKNYDEEKELLPNFYGLLPIDDLSEYNMDTKGINESPNKKIAFFLRNIKLNPINMLEFEKIKSFLINESSIRNSDKFIYPPDVRKKILAKYDESNNKLAKEYFDKDTLFDDGIQFGGKQIEAAEFNQVMQEVREFTKLDIKPNTILPRGKVSVDTSNLHIYAAEFQKDFIAYNKTLINKEKVHPMERSFGFYMNKKFIDTDVIGFEKGAAILGGYNPHELRFLAKNGFEDIYIFDPLNINFDVNIYEFSVLYDDEEFTEKEIYQNIKTFKIDDFEDYITYIKLDFPKVNLKALKGGEETIKKHKPTLAISFYDGAEYKELTEYIQSLELDYKMTIKTYSVGPYDRVLYCY